jgi:murein DD-endopeptidase MepM/ murein hydrolase activator NlpD
MGIPVLTDSKTTLAKQALRPTPISRLASGLQATQDALHRHPRRVSAAVLALLAGSAFTAFGVAPLSTLPDAALPVITQVQEQVEPALLPGQIAQLDGQVLSLYRNDLTRPSDTADTLLRRLGVDDAEAARLLRQDPTAATLLQGRAGKLVKVIVDNGKLRELIARSPAADASQIDTHFTRLRIERQEGGLWTTRSEQVPLQVTSQMASGTIQSSLFAAADDAKVPDGVTNQIAEIFGNDIDFRRELRKGDAFSVLYEAHLADGEPITWGNASGRVLAARFINKGETHDAVWFQQPGSKGAYFDLTGRSKTRAFLASPLAFSRVTSGFAMRFHPIQQKWKAHLGVDFGAPTGTAVRSVGDAVVSFAGQQNGYGNVVELQHAGDRKTVYAHLSRIDVRKGQKVEQGQLIGAVGATGWATGPHLHFEFKIKGTQVDPMQIARASESLQLSPQALAQFKGMAGRIAAQLDRAGEWQAAGAKTGPRFE